MALDISDTLSLILWRAPDLVTAPAHENSRNMEFGIGMPCDLVAGPFRGEESPTEPSPARLDLTHGSWS